MLTSFCEELLETKNELAAGNAVEATREMADAVHAFVWIFVFLLPKVLLHRRELYYLVFFLAGLVTPYKQGKRFMVHGCIRSPRNCQAGGHVCKSRILRRQMP